MLRIWNVIIYYMDGLNEERWLKATNDKPVKFSNLNAFLTIAVAV